MFDFITEEHKMIQQAARDFARKEIAPIAEHHDATGEFPLDTVRQMGQLGFMGIEVPEAYGGAGMDTLAYVLALDRNLARSMPATAPSCQSTTRSFATGS